MKRMNEVVAKRKKISKKEMIYRLSVVLGCSGFMFVCFPQYAFALNIGENISTLVSTNMFWIGLAVLCGALLPQLLKRSWVSSLITVLGGGVVLYIIKNPSVAAEIGEKIGTAIFK